MRTISSRLRLGFSLMVGTIVVGSLLVLIAVASMHSTLSQGLTVHLPALSTTNEMEINLNEIGFQIQQYLRTGETPEQLERDMEEFKHYRERYARIETDLATLNRLEELSTEFLALGQQLIEMRQIGATLIEAFNARIDEMEEALRGARSEFDLNGRAAPRRYALQQLETLAAKLETNFAHYILTAHPDSRKALDRDLEAFRTVLLQIGTPTGDQQASQTLPPLGLAAAEIASLTNQMIRHREQADDRWNRWRDVRATLDSLLDNQIQSSLQSNAQRAAASARRALWTLYLLVAAVLIGGTALGFGAAALISRSIVAPLRALTEGVEKIAHGHLDQRVEVAEEGELGVLASSFNRMAAKLQESEHKAHDAASDRSDEDWVKTYVARLSRVIRGKRDLGEMASLTLSELAEILNVPQGAIYVRPTTDSPTLELAANHASQRDLRKKWEIGEGLVGQCAREKRTIVISDVPPGYLTVGSALGEADPRAVTLHPLVFEGVVQGVLELAWFHPPSALSLRLLDQASEYIAVQCHTITAAFHTEELLRRAQALGEELRMTNEELQAKNQAVEESRVSLEEKAEQLSLTSKYKSQFLANMSHELRTPLNSLLILSQQLRDNSTGNLTATQVQYAQTIHDAGKDLLGLINEILDLAKIESGTMSLDWRSVSVKDLVREAEGMFTHVAASKEISFAITIESGSPETIQTDRKRLMQVVKNLLSNAFKFTEKGEITVAIFSPRKGSISFSIRDTGIGIPLDKQKLIFEEFQQASQDTARRYGGTGLGLAISREIVRLLGGEIEVKSAPGMGSTFTLTLPVHRGPEARTAEPFIRTEARVEPPPFRIQPQVSSTSAERSTPVVDDDRNELAQGDPVMLIIEDDPAFARVVRDRARVHGFKTLVTPRGEEGLALAREHPVTAISLDILLEDISGWLVLERLKHEPLLRHVPVLVLTVEEAWRYAKARGAFGFLPKPVSVEDVDSALERLKRFSASDTRCLLVVEDSEAERQALRALMAGEKLEIVEVADVAAALDQLRSREVHCVLLDLRLPGMEGTALLQAMDDDPLLHAIPVLVHTGRELSREETTVLKRLAANVIRKNELSPDRLLLESSLFLHRPFHMLSSVQQQRIQALLTSNYPLEGASALVVDDDMRNLFSLTALLERHQMKVVTAENGRSAIDTLEAHPEVDVVVMDIMMPEMDGYEAMRRIREIERYRSLPIVALTARAMRGERERCFDAGASDYLTKPVDTDELIASLKGWLWREHQGT